MDTSPVPDPQHAPPVLGLALRLLGAAHASRAGQPLRLPRKSLALLAYIALAGPTTRSHVATLFWGEQDNAGARRNLRRELHRLGEVHAADFVVSDGERLSLAPEVAVDVPAFERLLSTAPADALALYTGPLLDGLEVGDSPAYGEWLAHQRERLAQLRRGALREELARHEAAGRPRQALDQALLLLADDPLQEAHYADAMRLYYLVRERTRALDLFERCRTMLRSELGLEPLPATTALADRIRAAERLAPIVATGGVRGLAQFDAPLAGRDAELAALRACSRPLALIEGEPGVGKSRLAAEYALDHRPLLHLRGSAIGRGAPLHPLIELLQRALDDPALRAVLTTLPTEDHAQLAGLLPALDVAVDATAESTLDGALDDALDGPPGVTPASDTRPAARARFFAALTRGLDTLLDNGVLVADDLQWLDDATLEALESLARLPTNRTPRPGPRIVFTARTAELAQAPAARDMLRRLQRAGLLTAMLLTPLDEGATLQLVRELSGSSGGQRFAGRLQRATGGNAFFMLETIRYLFDIGELVLDEQGQWSTRYDERTDAYAELPVPPTVQQALVERVERLGPVARRVLEAAALAGDPFTLDDVQPATALGEFEALDGLECALQAQVVQPVEAGGFRYIHDLARNALSAALLPERRRLIHLRLAETLEARRGRPDRIALHLEGAGQAGRALPWRMAAAKEAERLFAWREALAHLAAALAAPGLSKQQRAQLHRDRCELHTHLFAYAELLAEADALAQLAAADQDAVLNIEALIWRMRALQLAENTTAAGQAADAALAAAADLDLPAELRFDLDLEVARALHGLGRPAEAMDRLRAADAALPAVDPSRQMQWHFLHAHLRVTLNEPAQALAPLQHVQALARSVQDEEMHCKAASVIAYVLHTQGETKKAVEVLEEGQRRAEIATLPGQQRALLTNLVKLHVALHEPALAQRRMTQALQLFGPDADPATQSRLQSRMTEVCLLAGDLTAALESSARSIELLESMQASAGTFWPWYQRARLLWQLGDSAGAVDTYRRLRHSPAWSALAEPVIDFYTLAFLLPHKPQRVLDALLTQPAPEGHAYFDRQDVAFWTAQASLMAGDAARAWQLLQDASPPAFTLHAASLLALQLRAAAALGRPVPHLLDRARELRAPPLERLELLTAQWEQLLITDPPAADRLRAMAIEQLQQLEAALPAAMRPGLLAANRRLVS